MTIEVVQPHEPDSTSELFEVRVDGEARGRFTTYPAAVMLADELASELPSPFA